MKRYPKPSARRRPRRLSERKNERRIWQLLVAVGRRCGWLMPTTEAEVAATEKFLAEAPDDELSKAEIDRMCEAVIGRLGL